MDVMITQDNAPAMGDLQKLGKGDTVWLSPQAQNRKDWSRYTYALLVAVSHGANAIWMGEHR